MGEFDLISDKEEDLMRYLLHLSCRITASSNPTSKGTGQESIQERIHYLQEASYIDAWNLPKLRDRFPRGVCAMVFSFEWLPRCRVLQFVQLDILRKVTQRLPLS